MLAVTDDTFIQTSNTYSYIKQKCWTSYRPHRRKWESLVRLCRCCWSWCHCRGHSCSSFCCPLSCKLYKEALQKRRQLTSSNYQKTTEEFVGTANSFFQDFLLVELVWYLCIETFLLLLHHHRLCELFQRWKATTYLIIKDRCHHL